MLARLRANGLQDALPLAGLILFQVLCLVVFLLDVTKDIDGLHALNIAMLFAAGLLPELAATAGLLLGILFELWLLRRLLHRQQGMTRSLSIAAGALSQVMEGYFAEWALTPAERDVAAFTIKGFSIAEIAKLRGSAEGTIKTHLNAIYRKAGVAGRAQLVSLMVEDLMRAPLLAEGPSEPAVT